MNIPARSTSDSGESNDNDEQIAIQTTALTKRYGEDVLAVDNLDLTVYEGEIFEHKPGELATLHDGLGSVGAPGVGGGFDHFAAVTDLRSLQMSDSPNKVGG